MSTPVSGNIYTLSEDFGALVLGLAEQKALILVVGRPDQFPTPSLNFFFCEKEEQWQICPNMEIVETKDLKTLELLTTTDIVPNLLQDRGIMQLFLARFHNELQ